MMSRFLPSPAVFLAVPMCAGIFLFAAPPAAPAQQPPPIDPAAVLATIKELKTKQADIISREKTSVLSSINAAISDPAKAYEQAAMAVEIQGNSTNEGGRTADWRKRNGQMLRDRDFLEAVRLHLTWLALTWQHSMGVKVSDQIPALLNYTSQVANDGDLILAFDNMRKPVSEGLFAAYFQVGPFLTKSENWEDQPFNVESIFRRTILPQMRADKDPRLLDYWNQRIQTEASKANATGNGLAVSKSKNVKLPALFWNRAEAEYDLGQVNQAVADMMVQIKAHPDHPDFDHWINRVTEIVTPPKGEVTVSPAAQ